MEHPSGSLLVRAGDRSPRRRPRTRTSRGRPVALAGAALFLSVLAAPAAAQHAHAEADARLEVRNDTVRNVLTVRVGPLDLPADASHEAAPQAPDLHLEIPFDGWLTAYRPRLVDGDGDPLPGRLLHHVAFWNTERSAVLCPGSEEHIFGAGGEMNEWPPLPGIGYGVERGDTIRISTMFHNPTDRAREETWLEVDVRYDREAEGREPLTNVYPLWFDVQECGDSAYDLEPGENVTTGEFTMPFSGTLLGVGGHLHDHARELRLHDVSADEEIARLEPELDERGRILSVPVVPFLLEGGVPLEEGDTIRVTARYDNPTDRRLEVGAMGIVVGYFVPDDPDRMAERARE